MNQLMNPLQSRCSFSDSDLKKLLPKNNKPFARTSIINQRLENNNILTAKFSKVNQLSKEDKVGVSITNIIRDTDVSKNINSKEQLSQLVFTVFVGIFYKALKSNFLCPICNDFLKKPKVLPSCGHVFCSHCLAFWFSNNHLRSCPVCRKFSKQNQPAVPTCTVSAFIERTEKLRKHFKHHANLPHSYQTPALLNAVGLPISEKNELLLEYLLPKSKPFKSKSLENIHKKWAFQQLIHNLRFAQRQATNRFFVSKPPGTTTAQRYRMQIIQVIKMICPFYGIFSQIINALGLLYTGRVRIVVRRPTVDQLCMLFIAVMMAVFILMVFNYIIQKGMKTQIKMLLHFTIVLMVNDFVHPP